MVLAELSQDGVIAHRYLCKEVNMLRDANKNLIETVVYIYNVSIIFALAETLK